jgi:hypothetical protein
MNSKVQQFGEERVRANVGREVQVTLGGVVDSRAPTHIYIRGSTRWPRHMAM